jgi:hypothetical protein
MTNFDSTLISEYLQYHSINQVFRHHHYNLPISPAQYHRVLDKYGIVKSAGPNSSLSESLYIFGLMNSYKMPLESLYHRYAPHTLQVSTNTLHRILHLTRLGITRRLGTALIITSPDDPSQFLTGIDSSLTGGPLGKMGDLTIPMGYSRSQDTAHQSIARVLQREVYTQDTIAGQFPSHLIPTDPKPVFHIDITDIRVAVYHLSIPKKYHHFSSFKILHHAWANKYSVRDHTTRPGVLEIIDNYYSAQPIYNLQSNLNLNLAKVTT